MLYAVSFLEGIVTFISPCLLPMLPVYLSWFAGGEKGSARRTAAGALGFIAGFTAVFMVLGALAGTLGGFLSAHAAFLRYAGGAVLVLFGLSYMGLFRIPLFRGGVAAPELKAPGFFRSFVFGVIFSLGWTPCVGTFLGSALIMASQQGSAWRGMLMLLLYSLGLGIPFLISALLVDSLKAGFPVIRRHYAVIDLACGLLLVLAGVLMALGVFSRLV